MVGSRTRILLWSVVLICCCAPFAPGQIFGSKKKPAQSPVVKDKYHACDEVAPFAGTTLYVITTVRPPADKTWKYPEGPAVVAEEFLKALNANKNNNTFKEPDGVPHNLSIAISMNGSSEGTIQVFASATVRGLGKSGDLFSEDSGQAGFTSWVGAIDKLAENVSRWIGHGWTEQVPCVRRNGSVRMTMDDPMIY